MSVGILMKPFFLWHKCINKWVHKLLHKQIYYSVKGSYYIHALSCVHFGKLQTITKISCWSVKNQFLMIFDALANYIFPV